ncbi:MAG: DUF3795 domain-containing protein [Candidatus Bathyarchaeota archaeon]|nr:MAG: DUF3795 domain-containing protein [Candidatus Bathyarchaeota archaeon]
MTRIPKELAPCGVFCGACPSFEKSCLGCASDVRDQKRSSKWSCQIRQCCYDSKKLSFCGDCVEFPCTRINKKLIRSHLGDARFKYRHEIPNNFVKLMELGVTNYRVYQRQRWTCSSCGGLVQFYNYRCSDCGRAAVI